MAIRRDIGPIIVNKEMFKETAEEKEARIAFLEQCRETHKTFGKPHIDRNAVSNKIQKEIDKFNDTLCDEQDPYNIAFQEGIINGLNKALGIIESID